MPEYKKNAQAAPNLVLLSADREENYDESRENISEVKQKYKDTVLLEIYVGIRMLHSTLANRLPVSASGLNAIVKKLNEAQPPPIRIDKQGKFTFYSLEEAGLAYVRDELMPVIAPDREAESGLQNIYTFLNIFKDRNAKKWMEVLDHILEGDADFEEQEEGFGFLKELGAFHSRFAREAESILEITVVDRELRKKILDYLKENRNGSFDSPWDVLNCWEKENCLEVYRMIDDLFSALTGHRDMPEADEYVLQNAADYLEPVLDKLQAGILQILFRRYSRPEAINHWIQCGVEKHLAAYLTEKYENCCFQETQKKERRASCI